MTVHRVKDNKPTMILVSVKDNAMAGKVRKGDWAVVDRTQKPSKPLKGGDVFAGTLPGVDEKMHLFEVAEEPTGEPVALYGEQKHIIPMKDIVWWGKVIQMKRDFEPLPMPGFAND